VSEWSAEGEGTMALDVMYSGVRVCVRACVRGGAISRPPGPPPPPPASRHLETCYEIVMIGTHRGASIAKALPLSR